MQICAFKVLSFIIVNYCEEYGQSLAIIVHGLKFVTLFTFQNRERSVALTAIFYTLMVILVPLVTYSFSKSIIFDGKYFRFRFLGPV